MCDDGKTYLTIILTFLRVSLNRTGASLRINLMHGTHTRMYVTYARKRDLTLSTVRTTARGTISVYNVYTAIAHVSALYSALYSTICCAISHACMYVRTYVYTMSPDHVSRKFMRLLYSFVNVNLHRSILFPHLRNFAVWVLIKKTIPLAIEKSMKKEVYLCMWYF